MTTRRIKKRQRTTRKQYLDQLKNRYPSCKHDEDRSDRHLYTGHDITYGEMQYAGIDALYKHIVKRYDKDIDAFIDVGSGRGKLCMYMAAHPKIKHVLGIELVKQRHDDAIHLRDLLAKEYSKKVELLNQNVLEIDFEKFRDSKVFVWFSNLCFNQSITNEIFHKLYEELPKGSIICCSKIFDIQQDMAKQNEYEYIETIPIEMSWTKSSNVYIYKTV